MSEETKKFFEELATSSENGDAYKISFSEASNGENGKKTEKKSPKKEKNNNEENKKEILEVGETDIFEESEGQLTIDVYQSPSEIVVESTIAGVKPENLDISINNESVTIRGKRDKETKVSDEDYFYQECYWGRFSRTIILPQEIDAEKSTAILKNGILTIHLPKLNRQKSKKLKVRID